jgi:hypothetical protein
MKLKFIAPIYSVISVLLFSCVILSAETEKIDEKNQLKWVKSGDLGKYNPMGDFQRYFSITSPDKNSLIKEIYIQYSDSHKNLMRINVTCDFFRTSQQKERYRDLLKAIVSSMGNSVSRELGDSLLCKDMSSYESLLSILLSLELIPEDVKEVISTELDKLSGLHNNLSEKSLEVLMAEGDEILGSIAGEKSLEVLMAVGHEILESIAGKNSEEGCSYGGKCEYSYCDWRNRYFCRSCDRPFR